MNLANVTKRLLSNQLKEAYPIFMSNSLLNKEEGDATNKDYALDNIINKLLVRHAINLKDCDTTVIQYSDKFDLKERTITVIKKEKWRYCEQYYVDVLINISAFRRAQIEGEYYSKRTTQDCVADAVVAYQILDYLQLLKPMHQVHIAKHFYEGGGHHYNTIDSCSPGSSLQLEVDKQLNLILNHKGAHLNYHYYSYSCFANDFNPDIPYLSEPEANEEGDLDNDYRDSRDFDILDGLYGR